ncbi:MAG: hypothetical protein K0S61_376 [Anaerocolumna sp.]|nr:hypothetical protein [Anaerocolumna sp.]
MKKRLLTCIALFMVLVLTVPILPFTNSPKADAASSPTISASTKTLMAIGSTFTLTVKNLDSSNVKSAVWYSSNKKIATVLSSRGYVTAVGKGTTWIKVKITYKNKKVKTLGCKVTVKVPATGIAFTNANDTEANNGRHVIEVGESYDFNAKLTPSNANDLITYSFKSSVPSLIKLDSTKGIVTGLKPGYGILTATASLTKAGAATSYVTASINVEIVDKTARVSSITVRDSTTLIVLFDRAIDKASVMGTDNKLNSNVSITAKTNSKGVVANGVGTLTGSLSTDGKTLTVTSTKIFNGLYGIHVSGNIKTTDGINVEDNYKEIEYYDTVPPAYTDYKVDDTGLIVSINFSEPMDFSALSIVDAKLVTNNTTAAMPATLTTLKTKTNYKASADGRSLVIDLTNMTSYDRDKLFAVTVSGIKDMAGNYPRSYPHTIYLATDTAPKAQAALINIVRSNYNTLTATFTRAIQTPGYLYLNNSEMLAGVVDATDNKKVNYTLTTTAQQLTGSVKVSIGYWNAYNVRPTDNSANNLYDRYVDFKTDRTVPTITGYELITETIGTSGTTMSNILKITYNKNITLTAASGTFVAKLVTTNNDIYSNYNVSYTAIAKDNVVSVILDNTQFNEPGSYTLNIPEGFVRDEYLNVNGATTVLVQKGASSSSILPAPKTVGQDPSNASLIYVTFAQKIDKASAETVSNYTIAGVSVISAELMDNTSNGSTVKLTLLSGSIPSATIYPITIRGIRGFNNTYSAMDTFSVIIALNENSGPMISTVKFSYPNTITMTYNEAIYGTASFKVLQNNKDYTSSCVISNNMVIITLSDLPTMGTALVIQPTNSNNIKDAAGNISNDTTRTVIPTIN